MPANDILSSKSQQRVGREYKLSYRFRFPRTYCVLPGIAWSGREVCDFPGRCEELPSRDGQFLVRSISYGTAPGSISGKFHALVLEERRTGKSHKLCDYLGKIMVFWTADNVLVVNDYYTDMGARVLLFVTDETIPPVAIDKTSYLGCWTGSRADICSGTTTSS